MGKLLIMIKTLVISIPFKDIDNAPIYNYFRLSDMPGEFLVIQKEDGMFYFLYFFISLFIKLKHNKGELLMHLL